MKRQLTNLIASSWFDWLILGLILISVGIMVAENSVSLNENVLSFVQYLQWSILAIFMLEYAARLFVAESKLKHMFSIWGIIDLLAIVAGLGLIQQLSAIRIFRLLRVMRMLRIARYTDAVAVLGKAFASIRAELSFFGIVSLLAIFVSGIAVYHFENEVQPDEFATMLDGIWWAIATLSTVGYGDIYPVTLGGKVIASFIILLGIGIIAMPSGLFATALMSAMKNGISDSPPANLD